jgi:hypothetical protein
MPKMFFSRDRSPKAFCFFSGTLVDLSSNSSAILLRKAYELVQYSPVWFIGSFLLRDTQKPFSDVYGYITPFKHTG